MFVSHTHKLLFFEVPRTGSRSITQALTALDPYSPTAVVRAVKKNLYHYHVFDPAILLRHPDYALVAVHRNPYDRLRSHFKYRKEHGNPDELKKFTFEQYLQWVCFDELPFTIGAAMIDRPITELIPYSDVDHWLAYERLNDDWLVLANTLNIELPLLTSINSSKSEYDSESVYTHEMASWVQARFRDDFEQFGYAITLQG